MLQAPMFDGLAFDGGPLRISAARPKSACAGVTLPRLSWFRAPPKGVGWGGRPMAQRAMKRNSPSGSPSLGAS